MRRPFKILAVAALTLSLPVTAAFAAEIKLMCPAPMRTTIVELVAQFERASPHKVTIVHTPSRMIVERIQGGEAFDVSILTAEGTPGDDPRKLRLGAGSPLQLKWSVAGATKATLNAKSLVKKACEAGLNV